MSETPITPKIKERAKKLWEDAGSPEGRMDDYIEKARELAAFESNPDAGLEPVEDSVAEEAEKRFGRSVEEAKLQENLGEFPGLQRDQGEREPTPEK